MGHDTLSVVAAPAWMAEHAAAEQLPGVVVVDAQGTVLYTA